MKHAAFGDFLILFIYALIFLKPVFKRVSMEVGLPSYTAGSRLSITFDV